MGWTWGLGEEEGLLEDDVGLGSGFAEGLEFSWGGGEDGAVEVEGTHDVADAGAVPESEDVSDLVGEGVDLCVFGEGCS